MADITQELALSANWTDITTELSLVDDKTYAADLIEAEHGAAVYQAATDDSNMPGDGITGHPWRATSGREDAATRSLKQTAGRHLWMRATGGRVTVVVTEV